MAKGRGQLVAETLLARPAALNMDLLIKLRHKPIVATEKHSHYLLI